MVGTIGNKGKAARPSPPIQTANFGSPFSFPDSEHAQRENELDVQTKYLDVIYPVCIFICFPHRFFLCGKFAR